jgi:tetratricopeptide (TPR) repeat protein
VRIEAARALADVRLEQLEPSRRPQLNAALAEWLAARAVVADRPDTHVDVAQVYARRGEVARAERELQTALRIDPENLAARINLADLYRATGHDAEAERLLRQTVDQQPTAAVAWHALGLALVRLDRREEALSALAKAAELAPSERDYVTTYAVALREVRNQNANEQQRRDPQAPHQRRSKPE